jgi:hypothetical protein
VTTNQPGRFVQDDDGLHFYGETYVHHATEADVRTVLRTIREMTIAGVAALRPFEIITATGLRHTRVRVALRWLVAVAPAWRRVRKGEYKVVDCPAWQRQVAAAWLGVDDLDEVGRFEVAAVFGDEPPPEPPGDDAGDDGPDPPGPDPTGAVPEMDPIDGLVVENLTEAQAVAVLTDAGAVFEKREDRHGATKSGWWQDGVWLAQDPREAVRFMNGD